MTPALEFAFDTFGDVTVGLDGALLPHAAVIRNVVAEGVLADEVGVDFFGIGEHHREDFAVSTPEMVLAAIAARTSRIKLGSAVTCSRPMIRSASSSASRRSTPWRRGAPKSSSGAAPSPSPFPCSASDLDQYQTLFEEKLDLFAELIAKKAVTWSGTTRASLTDQRVFPPIETGTLKTWVGVGGSPESVVRAARYELPMMLAIIGGDPLPSNPMSSSTTAPSARWPASPAHRRALAGYVADSDAQAREELWPDFKRMRDRIGRRARLGADESRRVRSGGRSRLALCRSPETVARKITNTVKALGVSRVPAEIQRRLLPHDRLMRSIESNSTA